MLRREVCFLVGKHGEVLWADVSGSATALPDSRVRWEAIWRCRHDLTEIAHSHPEGPAELSREDETTILALRSALGAPHLRFSVVAPQAMLVNDLEGTRVLLDEPWWADLLRLASGCPR